MITAQTAAMISLAGKDCHVTAGQHRETNKFHGMLMLNHPTPSGCDRWMTVLTDNRGFDTLEEAQTKFKESLTAAGVELPAQPQS